MQWLPMILKLLNVPAWHVRKKLFLNGGVIIIIALIPMTVSNVGVCADVVNDFHSKEAKSVRKILWTSYRLYYELDPHNTRANDK